MTLLFKNVGNQFVYTRAVGVTAGTHFLVSGMSGAAQNGLTANISLDGKDQTKCNNPIMEVGNGIYKILLTQTETNCDSGVVQCVCGPTAWFLFDPIYFQTSSTKHVFGLTSSTLGEVATTIKGATYDGNITQTKLNEMILSFLFGAVGITTNNGINTYSFRNSSGATSFTSICRSTDGIRIVRGVTG